MARVKFTVQCEMDDSQVGRFLGLLDYMQYCGKVGHTSQVLLRIDGDGAFRPEFQCSYQVAYTAPTDREKRFLAYSNSKDYDLYIEQDVDLD